MLTISLSFNVATALAPPDFIERLEKEDRLTPMSTVIAGVDIFIKPESKISGQIIENCGSRCAIRKHAEYLDDKAEANMNEFSTSPPRCNIHVAKSLILLIFEQVPSM